MGRRVRGEQTRGTEQNGCWIGAGGRGPGGQRLDGGDSLVAWCTLLVCAGLSLDPEIVPLELWPEGLEGPALP